MRGPLVLIAVVLLGGGVFLLRSQSPPTPDPAPATVQLPSPESAPQAVALSPGELPVVQVYKSPTCGCCSDWAAHLEESGFTVELVDTDELMTVKAAMGVPSDMGSCHTARVGGYVVEGHVPAADIKRLLAEAPEGTLGLAVPGMPVGSPGMEMPGQPADRYDVVAFDEDGARRVYAKH